MEVFIEILKYALPSIFLLVLTYMMLSNFMDNEEKRRMYFLKKETQKSALPIRMSAYERVALFLERIHPDRLLIRVPSKGINVHQYRSLLVENIRMEFEHNLSQQIYLSDEAWGLVVNAKSATVGMINNWAQEIDPKAPAAEFSRLILEKVMEMDSFPTKKAVRYLKGEIRSNF
jgi:hypothetical protein|tara:strand:+ start:159 stop:680 length:522 start_codon:yes stop_codon:yes gene_type:complete